MEDDYLDNLTHASNMLEWRNSQPYDGVLGKIENWWTDEIKDEFYRVRNRLLDAMDYKEHVKVKKIRQWIDEFYKKEKLQEDGIYRRSIVIPPKFRRDVSYLALIQTANSLGEPDGLPMLVSEMALMGKRKSISTSINASKLRPKKNYNGETLDIVITTLKRNHLNETLSELWVHLKTAIEEWSDGDCKESGEKDSKRYIYKIEEIQGSITYGTFRKKIKKIKNGI